jgi:hypothetical protein
MRVDPRLRAGLLIAGLAATFGAMYWVNRSAEEPDASGNAVVRVAERRGPRTPEPSRTAEPARTSGSTPAADSPRAPANAAGLDLTRLQRARSEDPSGDPFGKRSFRPAPPQRAELAPSAPVQVALPPPPPPPSAPPVPFTYLGRLSEDNRTTAFLASGERNLVVKPGDVIDNNYRVDEVTDRMVQLTYLPLNVKQTVSTGAQ